MEEKMNKAQTATIQDFVFNRDMNILLVIRIENFKY